MTGSLSAPLLASAPQSSIILMHIITPTSNPSSEQQSIFAQGASYLINEDECQIGVWTKNTPEYAGALAVTIGACSLSGSSAVGFLKRCVSQILSLIHI